MNYKILEADDLIELVSKVIVALDEGYDVTGGVAVAVIACKCHYTQAVIKR